jgi:glycerol-3-phosphate acyltransferase PlsY
MWADAALILGAYLLGSLPHLLFLAKLRHVDLNGDFHQSLWCRGGRLTGIAGVLGDLGKGITPVLIGKGLDFGLPIIALAGLAVVVGQMWPIFSRFNGEKGNSVALAMALTLTPELTIIALLPVIISLIIRTLPRLMHFTKSSEKSPIIGGAYSRSLPLGMALTFILLPVASWWVGEPFEIIICYSALFILIILRRITAGLISDLESRREVLSILARRILYDRATKKWR